MTKHNPSNERIKRQYFTFLNLGAPMDTPMAVGTGGPMKQPASAKAKGKTKATKHKIRSVEVETVANGFEIECRFKQPKGMNTPYIEATKHVFNDAKEANAFLGEKLAEMI